MSYEYADSPVQGLIHPSRDGRSGQQGRSEVSWPQQLKVAQHLKKLDAHSLPAHSSSPLVTNPGTMMMGCLGL